MGTTFGFSAFIKLVCLNQRPRITEMRKRLGPSKGGYDFHKITRGLSRRLLVDGVSVEELIGEAGSIKNPAERKSAIAALNQLFGLRGEFGGTPFDLPEVAYESPAGIFKVKLQPDFGAVISGSRVGIHVWNTMKPSLDVRLVAASLSLFSNQFEDQVDDLAVLDLRKVALIRMGDPARHSLLADRIVSYLEDMFLDLRSGPVAPSPVDRLRP